MLFSGRQPFGFILDLLPGNADLYLSRYMMGIQLASDVLAGVGLIWAGETAIRLARTWRPRLSPIPVVAGLMAAAVLITLPAWVNRAAYAASDSTSIGVQVDSDETDGAALDVLINDIKVRGGGRTYAGLPGNWGQQYAIGQVPVYAYLADNDVDEFGFTLRTPSLLADNEAYFNQADPAQYQLYNIRYVLMPSGMTMPVPATLLASSGRHRLYLVATSGYTQVVDTSGVIEADRPTWRHRCNRSCIPARSRRVSLRRSHTTAVRPRRRHCPSPRRQTRRPASAATCWWRHRTATSLPA